MTSTSTSRVGHTSLLTCDFKLAEAQWTSQRVHDGGMVGVGVGVDSGEDFLLELLVDHVGAAAFSSC